MVSIGKQKDGSSSEAIYRMALNTIEGEDISTESILDVGGGAGNFSRRLLERGGKDITLLDHDPSIHSHVVNKKECDLNERWPVNKGEYDRVFALEVIEHLENPRFFFREIKRALRDGGEAFVTTPHNESLFSRLNFLFTGQHRYFQDSCYPDHITPVLSVDVERICREQGIKLKDILYSGHSVVPKIGIDIYVEGKMFSSNFGVLVEK
jgi:2-polyprenyl-3-methyl-5-hydroxy-6-metoxy-1,4-benzoquinol methylase